MAVNTNPLADHLSFYWNVKDDEIIQVGYGNLWPGNYPTTKSFASGINDNNWIIGNYDPNVFEQSDYSDRVFIWDRKNGTRDLGNFGQKKVEAVGLNNNGVTIINGDMVAYIWDEKNGLREYPGLERGVDINNNGEIGTVLGFLDGKAAYFKAGQGTRTIDGMDTPTALNDRDDFVGYYASEVSSRFFGLLWNEDDGFTELGSIFPTDINNKGAIVGYYQSDAKIWDKEYGIIDLNELLVNAPAGTWLERALGINDAGQIIAYGQTYVPAIGDQVKGIFYLTTPEPLSMIMYALGGLGIAIARRRKSAMPK
jgi:uncharacterized membrane protein